MHWLAPRYEFLKELGRGGMAVVYLARERSTRRDVAIKVVDSRYTADPEAVTRFAREARTVEELQHPNIVQTLAIEELGGTALAIVNAYVCGKTLRELLRETGALDFGRATRLLLDVAAALAHAHSYRVVHRDVKPENIFIEDTTGRALLADFGIALPLDGDTLLTAVGSALGTPTYMSPEQVNGVAVDERTDIYALGLVGWEMLAGRRPWEGETLYAVLHKQQHEQLPSLGELRPDIPTFLLAAISGALHKDAAARWASASEFIARLRPSPAMLPDMPSDSPDYAHGETIRVERPARGVEPVAGETEVDDEPIAAGIVMGGEPAGVETDDEPIGAETEVQDEPIDAETVVYDELLVAEKVLDDERGVAEVLKEGEPIAAGTVVDAESQAAGSVVVGHPGTDEPVPAAEPVPAQADDIPLYGWSDPGVRRAVVPPRRERRWPAVAALLVTIAAVAAALVVFGIVEFPSGMTASADADSARATPSTDSNLDSLLDATVPVIEKAMERDTADEAPTSQAAQPPASGVQTAGNVDDAPAPAGGSDLDTVCSSPAANDQRDCLLARVQRDDVPLTLVYQGLISRLRDEAGGVREPPSVQALRAEQRTWLIDRDRVCRERLRGREGALWGAARAPCFAELSEQRADELRTRLVQNGTMGDSR